MKYTILSFFLLLSVVSSFGTTVTGTNTVDVKASSLKWTGYHLAKSYEHWGNITIKSGSLFTNGTTITGGEIIVDMKSISNGDISDTEKNAKLVNHLKSEEFFDVKNFNTATIKIKKSSDSEMGGTELTADITIKGITKEINFDVRLDKETNTQLTYKVKLMIDRSAHGVLYGWSIENAMISGEFQIEATIIVNK